MTKPSFLSLLALFLALFSGVDVSNAEEESCACVAAKEGFNIDCSDSEAMLAALTELQTNDCETSCTSDICMKNFHIIQSHHDYCLEDDTPPLVEDGLHLYENNCAECMIAPLANPSLPDCPAVNCDGSGNKAYQEMLVLGCSTDCSTTSCGEQYQILRVSHDSCPEGTLDEVSEFGIHEFEEPCEVQNCNIGATVLEQLVCQTTSASPSILYPSLAVVAAAAWAAMLV